jgi:hypothetical protein
VGAINQGIQRSNRMNLEIDAEILQRTTYCKHDFRCLSGDKRCWCKVKGSIGYDMLEIKPKFALDCKYHISFGDTFLCTCPARNEIYSRYRM